MSLRNILIKALGGVTKRDYEKLNEKVDTYKWQVRDTCSRAEKAERELRDLHRQKISEPVSNIAEVKAAWSSTRREQSRQSGRSYSVANTHGNTASDTMVAILATSDSQNNHSSSSSHRCHSGHHSHDSSYGSYDSDSSYDSSSSCSSSDW